MTIIKIQ